MSGFGTTLKMVKGVKLSEKVIARTHYVAWAFFVSKSLELHGLLNDPISSPENTAKKVTSISIKNAFRIV